MIPVGTVCYIRGDHCRAGQSCTVTGPLCSHQIASGFGHISIEAAYAIELSSGESAWPYEGWAAAPEHLVPIAPPGLTDDVEKREPETV